jgi:hypothetical protein
MIFEEVKKLGKMSAPYDIKTINNIPPNHNHIWLESIIEITITTFLIGIIYNIWIPFIVIFIGIIFWKKIFGI